MLLAKSDMGHNPRTEGRRFDIQFPILCAFLVLAGWCTAGVAADNAASEAKEGTQVKTEEAQPAAELAETPEAPKEEQSGTPEAAAPMQKAFQAGLSAEIDAAKGHRDRDIDLDQSFDFTWTPPKYQKLHLSGDLWLHEDLDSDESRYSTLRDIEDSYDSDVRFKPLQLNMTLDDVWGKSTLRIGRQRILESPLYNRIDGVYFKKNLLQWDWYSFAGWRASLYDDAFDDPVVGGGTGIHVTPRTYATLDFFWSEEDFDSDVHYCLISPLRALFGGVYRRPIEEEVSDSYLSLGIDHMITPNMNLYGRFSLVGGEADEFQLELVGLLPRWDVTYQLMYRRQMHRIKDRADDLTVYYQTLGPEETYDLFLIGLQKPISKKLTLALDAELRDADHGGDYMGNRDYARQMLSLVVEEMAPGVDATLSVEHWAVEGNEGTWAVTGEISKHWTKTEAALGADYERYREEVVDYNPWPFRVSELATYALPGVFPRFTPLVWFFDEKVVEVHENIYSIYGKVRWTMTDAQSLTARLTFEDDDGPDSPLWRLRAWYELRF